MNNDITTVIVVIIVGALLGAFAVGFNVGESDTQEEAVKAGVGYYTNNASGESVFKWREIK